jgi:GntR family transcriptional regulator / MocR family aminotransferase
LAELLSGLLDLSSRGDKALARQLTDKLRALITDGRLKSGERLPSSRTLARTLAISRNTVVQAIGQLESEGYLTISRSRRPVVGDSVASADAFTSGADARKRSPAFRLSPWAQHLGDAAWPPVYRGRPRAFQPGFADEREFPRHIWGRCLRQAAHRVRRHPRQGPNDPDLQQVLLKHLAVHRGVRAEPRQIMILPSAQAGLALVAKVLIRTGDVAWMESPGYGGAFAALRAAGATVCGLAVDRDGLKLAERRQAPRIIFVTPSHQYPTGCLMPISRRLDLLQFSNRTGAAIIEDDYDSEFHYDGRPVAALAGLDPSARVFYVGTFSKVMMADIRIGYLIVPEALVDAFELAQRHIGLLADMTMQAALAEFIERGAYRSHIRRMTRLYRSRRDRLVEALASEAGRHLSFDIPAGGMQLLARCKGAIDDVKLSLQLQAAGVITRPLSEMLYHRSSQRGLFLGFGAWNEAEIDAGARILGAHVRRS